MAIKKQFLKSKPVCKVTFTMPKDAAKSAESVHVVGEFNHWETTTPMQQLKNGDFKVVLELPKDQTYQYRYLINGTQWENDSQADQYQYVPEFSTENSVVITIQ